MAKNSRDNFLFNFISPIYGLFYKSQKEHYAKTLDIMKKVLDVYSYQSIIDVGCGTGALCSILNENGLQVTCVDPAKKMLRIGAKKLENKNIDFIHVNDTAELPFEDKSFDLSIASYVAHGLKYEERKVLYSEMSRITKHYVILYDYNDKRNFFTNIIEWAEGGDYFNFIKSVKLEISEHFKSYKEVTSDKQGSWYICEPF